jgi:hypothetical protein
VRARFSAPVQTGPGAHPASCTMRTGSFPRVKSCRGVTLTPHPLLVPWSRKGRAIPLLPMWAVRPVQSLSACTKGALYLQPNTKLLEKSDQQSLSCYTRKSGQIYTAHMRNFEIVAKLRQRTCDHFRDKTCWPINSSFMVWVFNSVVK